MKLLIITAIIVLLIATTPVLAYSEECYNRTHLKRTLHFNTSESGTITEYKIEELVFCPWNCSTDVNECDPKPYVRSIYLVGIFVVLLIVFLLLLKLGRR